MPEVHHQPVLVQEVLALFQPKSGDVLLDATLGLGGHARAYLDASSPEGRVVGLDADPRAIEAAKKNLEAYAGRVTFINANFSNIKDSLLGGGIVESRSLPNEYLPSVSRTPRGEEGFTHILFDLGVGSHQLADPARGFSFRSEGPLTMRYGAAQDLPAAELASLNHLQARLGHVPDALEIVRGLPEEELANVIWHYGEERLSRRIARAIKQAAAPASAKELAGTIERSVPARYERGRIRPATRTFQALRLAVNRELEQLQAALPQAVELLAPAGVIAIISFHSREDRIVKQFFKQAGALTVLTKKPVRPSEPERQTNPRSRSAKLRAAKKTQ